MIVANVIFSNGKNITIDNVHDVSYADKVASFLISDGSNVVVPYYNLSVISFRNIPDEQPKEEEKTEDKPAEEESKED